MCVTVFLRSTLTQQSTKGDRRWQSSKVDEDDGGHALRVQSISDVTEVLRVASSHIFDQSSEQMTCTPQGLVAGFGWNQGICKIRRLLLNCVVIELTSQHYTTSRYQHLLRTGRLLGICFSNNMKNIYLAQTVLLIKLYFSALILLFSWLKTLTIQERAFSTTQKKRGKPSQ